MNVIVHQTISIYFNFVFLFAIREKIKKFEIRDHKYIPIREGEDEKEVLRKFEERENPEYRRNIKEAQDNERAMQQGIHTGTNDDKEISEAQKRKGELKIGGAHV